MILKLIFKLKEIRMGSMLGKFNWNAREKVNSRIQEMIWFGHVSWGGICTVGSVLDGIAKDEALSHT